MAKGRPRKTGVKRTKSGQISRAASAYNENADAIALRMRVFGLTEKEARDQKAATYVGRLCLAGMRGTTDGITRDQYDAAMSFREAYENFQRAVKSPNALATGTGGASGAEGPGYEQWCQNAIRKWDRIQQAVQTEQGYHEHRGSNMWAALDYLVSRDEQHPHMVGDLRLALNAIGHLLGMIPRPKRVAVGNAKAA
ncbi:hypothetical protein [Devosia naphthalenivorans]|uniref:hypothetical protein n=1 Tax=Devosia naphthalenivorans TaxID=2082392 RepID=UPI000D3842E9|nr:hypothetical protein [Devosia naphthalenivorans]